MSSYDDTEVDTHAKHSITRLAKTRNQQEAIIDYKSNRKRKRRKNKKERRESREKERETELNSREIEIVVKKLDKCLRRLAKLNLKEEGIDQLGGVEFSEKQNLLQKKAEFSRKLDKLGTTPDQELAQYRLRGVEPKVRSASIYSLGSKRKYWGE